MTDPWRQRKIARVFPRRTSYTPTDDLVFFDGPPLERIPCDEVHVSCVFGWDRPRAERLVKLWREQNYTVLLGGPAYNSVASDFIPGLYVRHGFTTTSRGCIRRCPFCLVPQREGALRLLEIKPGWEIMDNNLLACPRGHIEAVCAMLDNQPRPAKFTGGLDSRLCRPWFASRLTKMRVQVIHTAYDLPAEKAHVERTIKMLRDAGLGHRQVCCYVLAGYEGDTPAAAEERLNWVFALGGLPFAMFYRGPAEPIRKVPKPWHALIRKWTRPAAIFAHKRILGAAPLFTQATARSERQEDAPLFAGQEKPY